MVGKKEFEQEMYDLIICKLETESDGWQSRYPYEELMKGLTAAYNLALDRAAENAEIEMRLNNIPFVAKQFSITTNGGQDDESFVRKYYTHKPSILNLKIKE